MRKVKVSPSLLIFMSFLIVIIIGALLLWLPFSVNNGEEKLNFIDALFTATSCVCVTGLTVVSNVGATMSIYGKIVMGILIEIGGLSFLTLAAFFVVLMGKKIGINARYLIRDNLNQNNIKDAFRIIKKVVYSALIIQSTGAILVFLALEIGYRDEYTLLQRIGISLFHSVSSFNNAGFDIFGFNTSMAHFHTDVFLNIVTMLLIVFGGLGTIVLIDLIELRKNKKLSLHSKIVLTSTIILIVFGTLFFYIDGLNKNISFLDSLFLSISTRTAGFASFDLNELSNGSLVIACLLMIIGASPNSTGGGLKTTTVFIILASIVSFIRGRDAIAFKRRISKNAVTKAIMLVMLAIIAIISATFFLSLTDTDLTITQILFEVISSFATVGLSLGITPTLSVLGRIVIIVTMFIGRVGLLSLVNILNTRGDYEYKGSYQYIEEKVLIG